MGYKFFISICTTFDALVLTSEPYMKKGGVLSCNAYTLSCCGICHCHLTLDYGKNVVESVSHSDQSNRWKP